MRMRKWVIAGIALTAVFLAILIAVLNVNSIIKRNRAYLLARAEEAIGRKISAGDIELTLWGGVGLRVNDLAIADDPRFSGGDFATLYLSPRDYHRIHMPLTGTLTDTVYVPGRLFSVAPHTVSTVPRVFARNERLIAVFETEAGPMAMVLVGALFVACIETVWAGVVTPPHGYRVRRTDFRAGNTKSIQLARGAEMGRFNMGSTVILLFGPQRVHWAANLSAGQPLRMGEAIGTLHS